MKPRILIVEDDATVASELENQLHALGYEVIARTGTAENAVILAEGLQPDLVLMDLCLKGAMDGIEAAALIRSNFDIPVIYLTTPADRKRLPQTEASEPAGYIIKPFEERELQSAIQMSLHAHSLEHRLRASEQWLAAALRSIGDGVVGVDERGRVAFLNGAAERLFGSKQEKLVGLQADDLLALLAGKDRIAMTTPVGGVLREGHPLELADHRLVGRDGDEVPVGGVITPLRDARGNSRGALIALRDLRETGPERRDGVWLEARLDQAQRSDAQAALAGRLVHEFNNLMTTIIGLSSLILADDVLRGPGLHEDVERIRDAGRAAASLLWRILPQDGQRVPHPQTLDLDLLLGATVQQLVPLAGDAIEVRGQLGATGQCVRADSDQVDEMLTHLASNAIEAMPEGGGLTLTTELVCLQEGDCRGRPQARPGTFVRLSVSDTGIGMDEATLDRIFEPYFTTKPKSAGLGLPTASGIAQQSGGWVEVSSIPGQGTVSQVYLPAVPLQEGFVAETQPPAARHPRDGRQRRILLVEDDDGVQTAVASMLEARGYLVARAGSARKALALFEAQQGGFDLLFSDVVLPDRDGLALAEYCLELQPGLAVLFTSGYTDQRSCRTLIQERGHSFLQKPFDLHELLAAVEQAMAHAWHLDVNP